MREKDNTPLGGMLKARHFKLVKRNAKPALAGRYYPSIKVLPSEEEINTQGVFVENKYYSIKTNIEDFLLEKKLYPNVVVYSFVDEEEYYYYNYPTKFKIENENY